MSEQKLSLDIISLLEEACEETINNLEILNYEEHGVRSGFLSDMVSIF